MSLTITGPHPLSLPLWNMGHGNTKSQVRRKWTLGVGLGVSGKDTFYSLAEETVIEGQEHKPWEGRCALVPAWA